MIPGPDHSVPGRRLLRHGRVVEERGEPVVRFDSTCALAGEPGAVCCGALGQGASVPLRRLSDAAALRPGDPVAVEMAAGPLTAAAVRVFGLPLLALPLAGWVGACAADWLALPVEPAAAAGGLVGLGIALVAGARSAASVLGSAELSVQRGRTDR